jgi:hypothetical protein
MGDLPVRQYVVTIPKMLRLCFKFDRKLLGVLSQCFYASVKELFQDAAAECGEWLPGMIGSLQTYGDNPTRFHPHLHSLVTDGLVSPEGSFLPLPCSDPVQIMRLFRHKLLDTLLAQDKITPRLVEILLSWRHPGFSVYQGDPIAPDDHETRQRLAKYMVHPPVALDRLRYHPETAQVAYYARNHDRSGEPEACAAHIIPALDFLAALCTHIPNAGQQLVRYCGAFSNVRRARADLSGAAPGKEPDAPEAQARHPGCADDFARQMRRSWARLIKKVYEADPLICPRCGGPLKIISLIDSARVIERILRHLKLWNRPGRPPPPTPERSIHYDPEVIAFDDLDQRLEPAQ